MILSRCSKPCRKPHMNPDQPPAAHGSGSAGPRTSSAGRRRYGSDLTDAEWAILEPLLQPPCPCGRKRKWPMRRIVEAIFYVVRAGCTWDMLPDGFPPHLTVYRWFARFCRDGTWEGINHHLVMQDRERVGREASPSAAIIDSQSAKTAEAGGPRGGACPRAGQAAAECVCRELQRSATG